MPVTKVKSYWDSGNLHFAQQTTGGGATIVLDDVPIIGMTKGTTYYVNAVTGSASNDGLTWDTAFDQVNTAITAVTALHAAEAVVDAKNQFLRHRIIVQGYGSGSATYYRYDALTAWPNYCDIIGVGASPWGNGDGIVRIGAASGATGATGSARGLGLYNLQFNAGGSYRAAYFTALFRSEFHNCTFGCAGDNAACDAALEIVTGSGNWIEHCGSINHAGTPVIGFYQHGTGNWNNCVVEDCYWIGSTSGYIAGAYLQGGTVVRRNTCIGISGYGIHDTSTETNLAGVAFYTENFCYGGASASSGAAGCTCDTVATSRKIANRVLNQTTAALEY